MISPTGLKASYVAQLFGGPPTRQKEVSPAETVASAVKLSTRQILQRYNGREVPAAVLLNLYPENTNIGSGKAAYDSVRSELMRAAANGETFSLRNGEVECAGFTLVIGSNASPGQARQSTFEQVENARRYAPELISGYSRFLEATYETSPLGKFISRERFEEGRQRGLAHTREALERMCGFKGEVITAEDGSQRLGDYTMSFKASSMDYNGDCYEIAITGTGRGSGPISFSVSGLKISV